MRFKDQRYTQSEWKEEEKEICNDLLGTEIVYKFKSRGIDLPFFPEENATKKRKHKRSKYKSSNSHRKK